MRADPTIGLLAIAAAMCLSGCARNSPAQIEISEVAPANTPGITGTDRIDTIETDLRRERAALGALRRGRDASLMPYETVGPPGAAEGIARRVCSSLEAWEQYRGGLASALRLRTMTADGDLRGAAQGSDGEQDALAQALAVRRKYSADYANWNMRIALLESHLAAASEESKGPWSEKLQQARAGLKALDEACQEEIGQQDHNPGQAKPEPSIEHGPAPGDQNAETPSGQPDGGIGDRSISGSLQQLCARDQLPQDGGEGLISSSPGPGYRRALADTCDALDRAVLLLQRSHGGEASAVQQADR